LHDQKDATEGAESDLTIKKRAASARQKAGQEGDGKAQEK